MKNKSLFKTLGMSMALCLAFNACSGDTDLSEDNTIAVPESQFVYNMDFDCQILNYDDEGGTTRASGDEWADGTTIYIAFDNGSECIPGKAVYHAQTHRWELTANRQLTVSSDERNCSVYYFASTVSAPSDVIYLTPKTWGYYDQFTAKFKISSANTISLTAHLIPLQPRLRFKGTSGTKIKVSTNISYVYEVHLTMNYGDYWGYLETQELEVGSNGYTPYIYLGFYGDNNKIMVENNGISYNRTFFEMGYSGNKSYWLNVPTTSSHSGWEVETNELTTMATGSSGSKDWTWDTSITGVVWGNMGYCGGNGSDVGTSNYGTWWGVASTDEFNEQLSQTHNGRNNGDGDMNAYMTFSQNGKLTSYSASGQQIRQDDFRFETVGGNSWKVGNLTTTAILWPYEINSGGNVPGIYEVVYMTDEKLTLVYPDGGDFSSLGNWGEATFWHFCTKTSQGGGEPVTSNCEAQTDKMVTFTDGMVTGWSLDTKVDKFYVQIYSQDQSSKSDADIIASLTSGSAIPASDGSEYIYRYTGSFYSADNTYYLYTIAYDSNGNHGKLHKETFTTRSANLPWAEISNIQHGSDSKSWTYNITMKSGATMYYLAGYTGYDNYVTDPHFLAYYVYRNAVEGYIEPHDWTSVRTTLNSGTCDYIHICTWGVNPSGVIGNCSFGTGSVSSSAPWLRHTYSSQDKIPREAKKRPANSYLFTK